MSQMERAFPFRFGTFIIASKRASDIVFVVDSRSRMVNAKEGDLGWTCDKLVIHPKFPLVITAGGMADLAVEPTEDKTKILDQSERIIDLINGCLERIRYERHLDIDKICDDLIKTIRPKIENTLTYAETELEESVCESHLIIGMFGKKGAELRKLEFTRELKQYRHAGYWLNPPILNDYSKERKPIAGGRTNPFDSAERIAEIHADEIARAIDAEAELRLPHLRSCGWPIRAAIVRSSGVTRALFENKESQPLWV